MKKFLINEIVNELHTIQDILRWTISRFSEARIWYGHGANNPWDEAVQLIMPSLHLPLDIPDHIRNARLTAREKHRIIERVFRRIDERIPVAYLTNKAWFCGHEFYVDERVFIPRSPIAELINNHFSGILQYHPQRILDMCTGSGCIAIACAYIYPRIDIDAVDISSEVLSVTEHNITAHGMNEYITPIRSDLFYDLPKIEYDLIITNPPYVDEKSMSELPDEYHHEPKLSLISGSDALIVIRRILACAPDYLKDTGVLICEIGNNMEYLIEKYPEIPFRWIEFDSNGDGVFMLNKKQIITICKYFNMYRN